MIAHYNSIIFIKKSINISQICLYCSSKDMISHNKSDSRIISGSSFDSKQRFKIGIKKQGSMRKRKNKGIKRRYDKPIQHPQHWSDEFSFALDSLFLTGCWPSEVWPTFELKPLRQEVIELLQIISPPSREFIRHDMNIEQTRHPNRARTKNTPKNTFAKQQKP